MLTTSGTFRLEIDRGPNWLFVTVQPGPGDCDLDTLANNLWEVAAKHFVYRLVVELDAVTDLPQTVVEQLIKLRDRLESSGGALRVCGLSAPCADSLEHYKLEGRLPNHPSRVSAVLGNDSSLRVAAMHFDPTIRSLPKPTTLIPGAPHIKPEQVAEPLAAPARG